MPILGITGGIASGKSEFRRLLLERIDADYFDADACARELLDKDLAVRQEVLTRVHPQAYDEGGAPNRPLLRQLIYQDAVRKATLEAILHPVIRDRWSAQAQAPAYGKRFFIVDIPLLFETNAEKLFDIIVTVACAKETQLDRLATRRGLERQISEKIIASQMPLSLKIEKSHHVIWNDGAIEALITQADLFSRYLHARHG